MTMRQPEALHTGVVSAALCIVIGLTILYMSRARKEPGATNLHAVVIPVTVGLIAQGVIIGADFLSYRYSPSYEPFQLKETGPDPYMAQRSGNPNDLFVKETVALGPSNCVPAQRDTWVVDRSTPIKPGTIFISVAAFRDIECKDTVAQIFAKAKYPERIFVGVTQQIKKAEEDCFQKCEACRDLKDKGHIRITEYPSELAMGPCRARFEASKLWDGEEFFFQIDSHTRFIQDWDSILLEEWHRCDNPKAVIGGYPATHEQLEEFEKSGHKSMIMHCRGTVTEGLPGIGAGVINTPENRKPVMMPFCGAGQMLFRYTGLFEVPYDPLLCYVFFGEEIAHSSRLWTSGYDFYAPTRAVISHSYHERKDAPRVWTNNDKYSRCREMGVQRIKYILGLVSRDQVHPDYLKDVERFGLGAERSLQDYWRFIGAEGLAHLKEGLPLKNKCEPGYYEKRLREVIG